MISPYLLLFILFPLPTGTDRKLRKVPWATLALIAVNFVVYLATRPDWQPDLGAAFFQHWGLYPRNGSPITLFTYMFIHVSPQHLFWNMLFLWFFGPPVEEALGIGTFLLVYFGGGLAAGTLNMAFSRMAGPIASSVPLVGASGAISAILAPFAVRFYRARIHMVWLPGLLFGKSWLQVPALSGVSLWLLETAAGAARSSSAQPNGGTAYWAHVGGFIFGLLSVELTGLLSRGQQEYLLEDARAAAARGHLLSGTARQCYQAFLRGDPDNLEVRSEYAGLLAKEVGEHGGARSPDVALALGECRFVVRAYLERERPVEAFRLYRDAERSGMRLNPPPGERLRLARAAEDISDVDSAQKLLRSVIRDYPNSPEDEITRLRLGQLLLRASPAEAAEVLRGLLERYPHSQWKALAAQLRENALAQAAIRNSGGEVNPA